VSKRSVVSGDPSMASQSQIQAASQTITPNGRNDGEREVRNGVEERLPNLREIACAYSFNTCHLLKGCARSKRVGVGGNDHALENAREPDFFEEAAQFCKDRPRKPGVDGLGRKGQHGSRIVAA